MILSALLGKSDHGVLSFQLNCYVDKLLHIQQRRNYNKGDYEKQRNELRIDWNSLLDPLQHDVDTQFHGRSFVLRFGGAASLSLLFLSLPFPSSPSP